MSIMATPSNGPGQPAAPAPHPNGDSPAFLHRSVSDALRKRITRGDLAGGGKLPALNELAAHFNVSTMTVRRALRTLELEGHVERLPNVGVFARAKPPIGGGNTLAFIGSDLDSPFQMALANGARRACQQHGGAMQLLDGHFDAELEAGNISKLPRSGARGAIILPPFTHPKTIEAFERLHARGFPMVLVDQTLPGLTTDLVSSDHEDGAYRATTYLLEHRHRQVLFLTHPPVSSSVAARIQGYERALRVASIDARAEWKVWIDVGEQIAGYREGRKWLGGYHAVLPALRDATPPVGVLAVDAYAGWGVYEACRELGLRIPDDVSLVAFDETEFAHAMRPPMTIIAQRLDDIGRAAVELIERRIQGEPITQGNRKTLNCVIVGVDLIERGSVAAPAVR